MNWLFRELTLALCDGEALENGLHRALFSLGKEIPVERLSLTAAAPDSQGVVQLVAEADQHGGHRVDVLIPMTREALEWAAEVTTDEPVIVNDPAQHPLYRTTMSDPDTGSAGALIFAPLGIGKRPVGALTVFSNHRNCFTPEHAALLKSVNEPFAIALEHWVQRDRLVRLQNQLIEDRKALESELWGRSANAIIGERFGLKQVVAQLSRVAPSESPVLLLGETGVGNVFANALHQGSPRASGAFVKMNCGAVNESLIDSELFGHEAGAFTGARSRHRGRFERAQGGTLFLDEIGELPPAAQLRLLRVLQHGEIERVGGTQTIHVDVRIVAATHRNLEDMVASGRFRLDLWFRLNVFPIVIPPLRERKGDIPALVDHILRRKAVSMRKGAPPPLAPGTLVELQAYDWPGNVRELENVLERALIVHDGGPLRVGLGVLPSTSSEVGRAASLESQLLTLDEVMAQQIRRTLEHTNGKIHGRGGAAELLGIPATTLRHRMDKLGIHYLKRERTTVDPAVTPGNG